MPMKNKNKHIMLYCQKIQNHKILKQLCYIDQDIMIFYISEIKIIMI
jgi:hypothetical protein